MEKNVKSTRKHVATILLFALVFASMYYFINHAIVRAGKETLENLLFHDNGNVTFSLMASRFVGPILSFASGGAGGIFASSLSASETVGAFIAFVSDIPQNIQIY